MRHDQSISFLLRTHRRRSSFKSGFYGEGQYPRSAYESQRTVDSGQRQYLISVTSIPPPPPSPPPTLPLPHPPPSRRSVA